MPEKDLSIQEKDLSISLEDLLITLQTYTKKIDKQLIDSSLASLKPMKTTITSVLMKASLSTSLMRVIRS